MSIDEEGSGVLGTVEYYPAVQHGYSCLWRGRWCLFCCEEPRAKNVSEESCSSAMLDMQSDLRDEGVARGVSRGPG